MHWKVRPSKPFAIAFQGNRQLLLAKTSASSGVYLNGGYSDPQIAQVFLEFLEPEMVVLDVGAHIGEYTVLFADAVGPRGHVHAFEIDPAVIPFLKDNVRLNDFQNVTVNELAISDCEGSEPFVVAGDATCSALTRFQEDAAQEPDGRSVEVSTTTLDAYAQRSGLPRLDALKLDVEGAEVAALVGGRRAIGALRPRLILIECHSDESLHRASALLSDLDYQHTVDTDQSYPQLVARR